MSPRISVVIPTYRRAALLDQCLEALLGQGMAPAQYEIIVVDDAGESDAREVVRRRSQMTHVKLHYLAMESRRGPAAARNVGWRVARGDIIAFTDDDTLPHADWLAEGLRAFDADPALIGAYGQIVVPLPPEPTDYELEVAGLMEAEGATANCFYRRAALERVEGFDERFTRAWREDADLFFRMLDVGPVAKLPDAVVVHLAHPARWGVSIGQQRKAMFNALLYKKHPQRYRERIQAHPPWHYYVMTGALGAGMAGVVKRRPALAVLGLALWGALTARFAAQRLQGTIRSAKHMSEMLLTSAAIPPLSVYWRLYGAVKYRVPFV